MMTKFLAGGALALSVALGAVVQVHASDEHKHKLAPDVDAFHNLLAPLWHTPAGAQRAVLACAKAAQLAALARQIRSSDAQALVQATDGFEQTCRTKPADTDASFTQLHDAFHRLIEHSR